MKFSKSLSLLGSVTCICVFAFTARAAVTLTPATGGTAISADSTGGTFTVLTGPVLTEGATGDIAAGTIVLECPAGFEFDTNSAVTVGVSAGGGTGNDIMLDSGTAVVTPSNITVSVSTPSDGTETSILTWSGINVRPTAGTPLASGTVTESGTATFTLASTPTDNYGAMTEVAGTVAALTFTAQPGSATAGAAFGTQPVVVTEDQFGNASTSGLAANVDVTVALAAGTGPLQGTTALDIGTAAGNGAVTFTDLRIDVTGNDKQLSATASTLTAASSSVFTVNHATASALAIQQQPSSSATAGVAFAQQPIVQIEDAFGNLVDDDNSSVVTAARNAGSGTLQGTVNVTVSGGVATFTDLSHNVADTITITFTSGSLDSATSSSVSIAAAAADHLVFTAQPGSATAGSAFGNQPSLVAEDQFGNASSVGLPANLNVAVALSSGTGTLQGTTIEDIGTAAGNGAVTFMDLRIDMAGSKQLTASASNLTSAVSSSFTVSHAAASALAIQQQPSSAATAGVAFAQQPIVQVQDAFGNLVDDDNSTVVTAARNAGSGTLQGTLSQTAAAGVATFTNLSHNVAGNITVTFTGGSLTAVTSSSIAISPATADRLVFATEPDSAIAGAAFGTQPSLVSQDPFGNASTVGLPANLDVTVTLSAGAGPLQGTATQDIGTAAGNGTVTYTDLRIDVAGTDKQLTASASGLTNATSSVFAVNHAAAAALAIQQQPSSTATAGVEFAQQPIVQVQDAFGNLVDDDNSTVVTAARSAGSGTLQGTLSQTAAAGVVTFTNLSHTVAGNITIGFTNGSLVAATSDAITINPAAADHLVFVTQPGSATAGSVFGSQPTMKSQDAFGNDSAVGLPSSLSVTLTLAAGTGPLQGTVTEDIGTGAGNGLVAFTDLRIDVAGTDKQLSAAASSLTGALSSVFVVNHAAAARLGIQTQPSSTAVAGQLFAQQPVIQIQDQFGNLVSEDNATTVTAARSLGFGVLQGTLTQTASAGIVTYTNLSHNVATNITVSFNASGLTGTNSSTVAITPAAADHMVYVTEAGLATAGSPFGSQPSLQAKDTFGNNSAVGLPAHLDLTIALTTGVGPLLGTTTEDIGTAAGNGFVAFTDLEIDTAGNNRRLTATASGLGSANSTFFSIAHAAAARLTIQQQPSASAIAGTAFAQQPIVRIEDNYGNLIGENNSSVITATRNAGSSALPGTTNITVVGGVATFTNLSYNVAETITIAFTSGSLTSATSTPITVSAAPADHLVFTAQPGAATAGAPFGSQPSVVTKDQFGNVTSAGLPTNLNVTITLSSGTGPLLGTATLDIGTLAGNGAATWTDLEIDNSGTGDQLTVSAAGLTNATSDVFSVAHSGATRLVITSQPAPFAVAGEAFTNQPVIQISDNFGNIISDDSSTHVTAAVHGGGSGLEGTVDLAAVNGVVTFTNVAFDVARDITLDFTAGSLTTATSDTIHVSPGGASALAIDTPPGSTAIAGQLFSPQPVISIRDAFGNICTNDSSTEVDVEQVGGNDLLGTTNIIAANGIVTYTNLSETAADSIVLVFTSGSLTTAISDPVIVQPGPVMQLVIDTQPSSVVTAGQIFPDQPVVSLFDAYGNLCVNDSSTPVTASRINGVGNLQGTTTMTAVAGIVTYTNLVHFSATSMNIQFTAGSISTVSDTVTVEPGPATRIIFTQQPAGAQAGRLFATQPIVQISDDYGNLPTAFGASVPITMTLSSGSGYLFGTKTNDAGTGAGNGLATFQDLQINAAGTKRLTASAAGFPDVTTDAFTNAGTAQPLEATSSYGIGGTANSMWVGNFRGASTARDVVVANHDDATLTLRMSKDDGTFDSAATISLPAHPVAVRAADLNNDGYDDLVVLYDDTNFVNVLLSNGSHGTNFAPAVSYFFSSLTGPHATTMSLSDLNGDGKQDLVIATAADNNVNVLFGTSGAAFTSPVTYPVGANPVWINISDVDHDGHQDIVTANFDDATVTILHGSVGADFSNSQTVTLDGNPQPIRVATPDINRDNLLDLAVVNYASNSVSILTQQTNGTFVVSSNYTVGTHPTDFFLRDLDGDGFSDLAVLDSASGTVDILFNHGTGTYDSQSTIAVGESPASIFGGKFASSMNINGLVVADSSANDISVLMYAGPISQNSSNAVPQDEATSIVLAAHNPMFPQIYHFNITQNPTNGTVSGTAPILLYTPDAGFVGVDHVKFTADVNGLTSAVATVTITVQSVNHKPTFTMATNQIALLQGLSYTQKNFITAKDPGAPNESAQKIDYIVTNIDTTLFATVPKIATNGTLTFKLAQFARGTNDILVYAHDNGGTARNGVNLSDPQVLRIIAQRFDRAPVVKTIPTVTMLEDSTTNIQITVTDADDTSDAISVTALSLNESIVPTANVVVTGPFDTNFLINITPAPDANGTATIQLSVSDGQLTTLATLRVTVTAVDDAPSFDLLDGEVSALQDSATVTISNFCTSISAGPANEDSQVLTFVVGNTNRAAFMVQPAIDKYGTLKFRPAAGYAGTNNFTVCLKDNASTLNGGVNVSDTNTFAIEVTTNDFRHLTGTYNGLFYEDSGVTQTSSGFVTFTLGYTRTFTGRIMISGGTYPMSGQFDTNGFVQTTVKRTGKANLTATLQVDLLGDSDEVTGDITDGTWDATLLGDHASTTAPTGTVGKYNAAFVGVGDGVVNMGGDAIGIVTLSSANRLSLTGFLPDKTILAQTVAVSKNGQWPLYVPLYGGAGSMIGWVTVTNDTQPLQAPVNGISLIKTNNNKTYYPGGFTNLFSLESSASVPFLFGAPVIGTNGTITCSSGNLLGDVVANYSMSANDAFAADPSISKFKLTFDKRTGYLNGTFVDPVNGLSTQIKGLVIPSLNEVRGYFDTPSQSGEFLLQGN